MRNSVSNILGALAVAVALSCSSAVKELPPALVFDPVAGSEAVYEVTETSYTVNDDPQQVVYFLRDVTVERTASGVSVEYKTERYRRNNPTENWRIERVISYTKNPSELIETGEKPVVKLTFPIREGGSFDVNRYNTSSATTATYKNVRRPFGTSPSTFSVVQVNDSTLINLRRNVEVYGPENGMVFKEITSYDYCQSSPGCIGKGIISFGKSTVWRRTD